MLVWITSYFKYRYSILCSLLCSPEQWFSNRGPPGDHWKGPDRLYVYSVLTWWKYFQYFQYMTYLSKDIPLVLFFLTAKCKKYVKLFQGINMRGSLECFLSYRGLLGWEKKFTLALQWGWHCWFSVKFLENYCLDWLGVCNRYSCHLRINTLSVRCTYLMFKANKKMLACHDNLR